MTRRLRQTNEVMAQPQMRLLTNASEEERRQAIHSMPPFELLKFDADFETRAHRNQLPPTKEGWSRVADDGRAGLWQDEGRGGRPIGRTQWCGR